MRERIILQNGQRIDQYLVKYEGNDIDSDECLTESQIPNSNDFLRKFRLEKEEIRESEKEAAAASKKPAKEKTKAVTRSTTKNRVEV